MSDEDIRARRLAEAGLVVIAAVWGLTFVMVQDAIALLPPLAFLAYRFIPAALLVGLPFWRRVRAAGRSGLLTGLLMGAFLTFGYALQTFGLERTTVSNAGFITGLFVVLTPLLGAVFLRQHATGLTWGAAGLAAVGLFLLSGAGGSVAPLGDLLVLGGAFAFAAHILTTAWAVQRHDVVALLAIQLGVAGVACLVAAVVMGDVEVPRGATVLSALVVTSVVASALGFFVQSYAQRHAPPARTALILSSEPAFAGLFGFLLAGERLDAVAWLGAALILVAILAVDLVPRWRPPRPLPEG